MTKINCECDPCKFNEDQICVKDEIDVDQHGDCASFDDED